MELQRGIGWKGERGFQEQPFGMSQTQAERKVATRTGVAAPVALPILVYLNREVFHRTPTRPVVGGSVPAFVTI